MNQALFERIIIDADEGATATFNGPFDLLLEAAGHLTSPTTATAPRSLQKRREARSSGPRGLSQTKMVDLGGLEPGSPKSPGVSRVSPHD
jgi:hypothetical protein